MNCFSKKQLVWLSSLSVFGGERCYHICSRRLGLTNTCHIVKVYKNNTGRKKKITHSYAHLLFMPEINVALSVNMVACSKQFKRCNNSTFTCTLSIIGDIVHRSWQHFKMKFIWRYGRELCYTLELIQTVHAQNDEENVDFYNSVFQEKR